MLPADALPRASQSRGGATRATATHDGLTAAAVAGAVLTTVAASAPSRRRRPRAPRGLLTVHDLDPPVDEAGEWVPRRVGRAGPRRARCALHRVCGDRQ